MYCLLVFVTTLIFLPKDSMYMMLDFKIQWVSRLSCKMMASWCRVWLFVFASSKACFSFDW